MINLNAFNIIFNDFCSWLAGLVEDDPIPFEIKSIIFFVDENCEIGFSGSEEENIKLIDFGTYFPLESQYFYSQRLTEILNDKLKDKIFLTLNVLEKLLDNYVKTENNIFFNKNIFYGKLFNTAKLLKFNN